MSRFLGSNLAWYLLYCIAGLSLILGLFLLVQVRELNDAQQDFICKSREVREQTRPETATEARLLKEVKRTPELCADVH